ncbi:hypothetical protein [Haloferula sargassicola]
MKVLLALLFLLVPVIGSAAPASMIEAASKRELPLGVTVDIVSSPGDKVDVTVCLMSGFNEQTEGFCVDGVLELWLGGEMIGEVPVSRYDDWGVSSFEFRVSRSLLPEAEFYLSSYFLNEDQLTDGVEIVRIQLGGFPIGSPD